MAVTRAAISRADNEIVLQWSRIASANEAKAITVAEILSRLIDGHIRSCGNVPPAKIGNSSERTQNEI